MSYNEAIKKKVTEYFVTQYNCSPYGNHGWYKGLCFNCGKFKFGFRLSDFRTNCFHCGNLGNPIKAIMTIEGFSTLPEAYGFLKSFEGMDYYEGPSQAKEVATTGIKLPVSFKLLTLGKSNMGILARGYMRGRGFNIMSLSILGVGYCSEGDYAGMIIMPFYRQSKLSYFTGRRFIALGSNKFKNPDVEELGVGKSELIYNEDALQIYDKIYIVESVMNALTLGSNAIAIVGKKASAIQLSKILRSPCKRVVICLDNDAISEAIQLAFKLIEHKDLKVLQFPQKQDVNDLGKKWVKEKEKQTPYHKYMDLINLKNQAA